MKWLETENDIEILRSKATLVQRENDRLHKQLQLLTKRIDKLEGSSGDALQQELELLIEKLAAQRAREFGPSSERKVKDAGSKDEPSKRRTGHGPTPQPNLEIVAYIAKRTIRMLRRPYG